MITNLQYMLFFKNKTQKFAELIKKFPANIENTKKMIKESGTTQELNSVEVMLNTLEQNFFRLIERYKFEEEKLVQILFDAVQYNDLLMDIIIDTEDVSKYGYPTQEYADQKRKEADNFLLKIEEIERRFKNLLGEQYVDPLKLLNVPKH